MDINDAKRRIAEAEAAISEELSRLSESLGHAFELPQIDYDVYEVQGMGIGQKPRTVFKIRLKAVLKGSK